MIEPQEEHVPPTVDDGDDDASIIAKAEIERLTCSNVFAFNIDVEADTFPFKPQEEQLPHKNSTDEDGVSNSAAAVVQQDQPQRTSRQPRRTQTAQLPEPTTGSEEEEDEDEESSKRSTTKTRARVKSNVHSPKIITYCQLEAKVKDQAKLVLDQYRDERQQGSVHVCSRFMSGKCHYMTKNSQRLYNHMKSHHPNSKHPGYKITEYPGFKDHKTIDFVTKPYSELKQIDPQLADQVLALFKRPQNRNKQKVHLCGHFVQGKCQYLSISTSHVKCHMANKHSRTLPMIKIVGYPGERERTRHSYDQMTYAELKSKRSKVADQVLKYYYGLNCRQKVHLCGSCDYFSNNGHSVREHIALHHPPTTSVYKIIQYPRLECN